MGTKGTRKFRFSAPQTIVYDACNCVTLHCYHLQTLRCVPGGHDNKGETEEKQKDSGLFLRLHVETFQAQSCNSLIRRLWLDASMYSSRVSMGRKLLKCMKPLHNERLRLCPPSTSALSCPRPAPQPGRVSAASSCVNKASGSHQKTSNVGDSSLTSGRCGKSKALLWALL